MSYLFPSEGWLLALVDILNSDQEYQDAASDWEGDFYFIIEPEGNLKERVVAYMDLWHGKCRSAGIIIDEKVKQPEFKMRASLGKWRKVLERKLNPIQGMMTGQLKVSGNMKKIVKNPKAALALVNCCGMVPTKYPGDEEP